MFNGWALSHGNHPRLMELDDLCDLLTHWMTRNLANEELYKWELDLYMPPPGMEDEITPDSPWSEEAEMNAFLAASASFGSASGAQ